MEFDQAGRDAIHLSNADRNRGKRREGIVIVHQEYNRLRDSFQALRNEFSLTGAAKGELWYDEYRVLPWTLDEMPRYRRSLDEFFGAYFPQHWTSWHLFDDDLVFGRFYGKSEAYEQFSRLASTGLDALATIRELVGQERTPVQAHVVIPDCHPLDAWLKLVAETAHVCPTAVLRVRRINHQCQNSTGDWVDLIPDFLYYEDEGSGRRTPAVPIRTILVNDLFRSSAEAIRLWLECLGEIDQLPVVLPVQSPTAAVTEIESIRTRVTVDDERKTIRIDEATFGCEDDDAREFFKLLAEANGEFRSFNELRDQSKWLMVCTNATRVRKKLPHELRSLVVPVTGRGYSLVLPKERLTRAK